MPNITNRYIMYSLVSKTFDRVWHKASWLAMKRFNINLKLIESIQNLYSKAESVLYFDGKVGECQQLE